MQIIPLKQNEKEGKWGHVYFDSAFKRKRKGERTRKKEVLNCSGAPEWLTRRSNLKDKKGKYRWFSLQCDQYTFVSCCSCFVVSISKSSHLSELCLYWMDCSLMKYFASIQLIIFILYYCYFLGVSFSLYHAK